MRPKGRKSRPMTESGMGFLEWGQHAPSSPTRGLLGEHCELPNGVLDGAPTTHTFFTISSAHGGLSGIIKKNWKILFPFNLESIIVHLVMLYDVF